MADSNLMDDAIVLAKKEAAAQSRYVVVIDGLVSLYIAPSASDNYYPQSAVAFTVIDTADPNEPPMHLTIKDDPTSEVTGPYAFRDFAALSADQSKSYYGLQLSLSRLADNVAKHLYEKE